MRAVWWFAVALGCGLTLAFLVPSQWVRWRSARRIRTTSDAPTVDVALVLGAGVRFDGTPTPMLRGRLDVARALYAAGTVRRILVSGSPHSRGHSEPVVMRNYLVRNGVAAEDVLLDETGVDTWSSCRAAVDEFGLSRLLVVTNEFHLRRAVYLCRRAGLDAYGVGHDSLADGLVTATGKASRREVLATVKAFWRVR